MSNLPVDRDSDYMYQMWGTKNLVTDYSTSKKRIIQEVVHDIAPIHGDSRSVELYEKRDATEGLFNDWEYGAEPVYHIKESNNK
jgi:hypothetical protein